MDDYEKALEAITLVFNDTSISHRECREKLAELIGEIQTMIECLDEA